MNQIIQSSTFLLLSSPPQHHEAAVSPRLHLAGAEHSLRPGAGPMGGEVQGTQRFSCFRSHQLSTSLFGQILWYLRCGLGPTITFLSDTYAKQQSHVEHQLCVIQEITAIGCKQQQDLTLTTGSRLNFEHCGGMQWLTDSATMLSSGIDLTYDCACTATFGREHPLMSICIVVHLLPRTEWWRKTTWRSYELLVRQSITTHAWHRKMGRFRTNYRLPRQSTCRK